MPSTIGTVISIESLVFETLSALSKRELVLLLLLLITSQLETKIENIETEMRKKEKEINRYVEERKDQEKEVERRIEERDKLDEEEHMHCFILCYIGNEVYHLEHPNWEKVGIYKFKNEEMAIKEINDYYVKISEGNPRPVTEFFEVLPNQSFKNFNSYINRLDEKGD